MLDSLFIEDLDIKTRIGTLQFDISLSSNLINIDGTMYVQKHNHSSYEIHFIVSGKGKLLIDNNVIELYPNSYFIIGPGIYHSIWQDDKNPLLKYHIKFSYTTVKDGNSFFPESETSDIYEILSKIRFAYLNDTLNSVLLIKQIRSELESKAIGYYSKMQCLFIQIMINLFRSITDDSERINVLPHKSKDDQRSMLIETFFDDFHNDLRIDQLACVLNLSCKQVNRTMKKLYNTTFKQKLIDVRIEVAKDLLRDKTISIELVSEKVGYSNASNFYIAFKKRTGFSPQEYRKTIKNDKSNSIKS